VPAQTNVEGNAKKLRMTNELVLSCISNRYGVPSWARRPTRPKPSHTLRWSEPDRKTLEEWARSRTQDARLVERAKMILPCVQGHSVSAHCAEGARASTYRD